MLERLTVRNFKSIRKLSLSCGPETPLVLLAGANGSGKSNLLEALVLLQGLGHGFSVSEAAGGRVEGGTRIWHGIRGGLRNAIREGAKSLTIETSWRILGDDYSHSIEIDRDGIVRESLANIFVAERDAQLPEGEQLLTEFLPGNHQTGRYKLPEMQSVLASRDRYSTYTEALRLTLSMVRALTLRSSRMRNFADKPTNGTPGTLNSDGSNLSAALWSLCRDPKRHDELVDWLSELGEREIESFRFEETSDDQVLFSVREPGGHVTSARSLSDGTLLFVALLIAIRTARINETLLLEDVDHGLHPGRLRLLLDAIEFSCSGHEGRRMERPVILATTHSPWLLDVAQEVQEARSYVFTRRMEFGDTQAFDLSQIPGIEEQRSQQGLAFLFSSNWVEHQLPL